MTGYLVRVHDVEQVVLTGTAAVVSPPRALATSADQKGGAAAPGKGRQKVGAPARPRAHPPRAIIRT
ncbi:MAG: hypothetical protein ACR2K2_02740, partial [Mycobacteriales bacterium]